MGKINNLKKEYRNESITERKLKKGLKIFKDEGSFSCRNKKQNMTSMANIVKSENIKIEKKKKLKTSKELI